RQLGQRVVLVHELRQLARAEEFLDRGHNRASVDQGRRRDRVRVADRHALLDDPLHPDEAHAELVLQELAHRSNAAVAEVVDVVRDLPLARRVVELDQLAEERDEVALLEDSQLTLADTLENVLLVAAQALVHLVSADAAEVSISSHAPRLGMSLAPNSLRPVFGSSAAVKYTPGERTSCDTTTRSVPLTMKVPSSVIMAKSPM